MVSLVLIATSAFVVFGAGYETGKEKHKPPMKETEYGYVVFATNDDERDGVDLPVVLVRDLTNLPEHNEKVCKQVAAWTTKAHIQMGSNERFVCKEPSMARVGIALFLDYLENRVLKDQTARAQKLSQ